MNDILAKTIEEYFGTLQQSTIESWRKHLKTDKYSAHIALDDFYKDMPELVDTLIENYMGIYGKVEDYKNNFTEEGVTAIEYLETLRDFVVDGKENLIDDSELESDIDAILSLIDSTLYKLKELDESCSKKKCTGKECEEEGCKDGKCSSKKKCKSEEEGCKNGKCKPLKEYLKESLMM